MEGSKDRRFVENIQNVNLRLNTDAMILKIQGCHVPNAI